MIDYIFRELAVSYLGRHDLAQVKPSDLRSDTLGDKGGASPPEPVPPDFDGEELVEERVVGVDEQFRGNYHGLAESSHLNPVDGGPPGLEAPALVPASARPSRAGVAQPAVVAQAAALRSMPVMDRARQARLCGYEGDPCGNCGQWTMVRNGTCLKCDTCGETSGCS
jgi:ribonucleoside-diphosphate reductase alpha chain